MPPAGAAAIAGRCKNDDAAEVEGRTDPVVAPTPSPPCGRGYLVRNVHESCRSITTDFAAGGGGAERSDDEDGGGGGAAVLLAGGGLPVLNGEERA